MKQLRPALARPPDFDAFWAKTREELAALDPALRLAPAGGEKRPLLERSRLTFRSLGDE